MAQLNCDRHISGFHPGSPLLSRPLVDLYATMTVFCCGGFIDILQPKNRPALSPTHQNHLYHSDTFTDTCSLSLSVNIVGPSENNI